MVPYFKCKCEKVPDGSRSNKNGGGRCAQSQKSSSLGYLVHDIESSLISCLFSFGTVLFGSTCLQGSPMEWFQMEQFLQRTQKNTDSGSKWKVPEVLV